MAAIRALPWRSADRLRREHHGVGVADGVAVAGRDCRRRPDHVRHWGSGQLAYGLYGDHAYMFNSLSTVNGTVMVNLLNPWGFDDPQPIPFSQIRNVIVQADFGTFSGQTVTDTGPKVAQQTANQTWVQGSQVSLVLAAGTFADPLSETMTYAATQANGQALPSWLSFNASTDSFSGTGPAGMETLSLCVTATISADCRVPIRSRPRCRRRRRRWRTRPGHKPGSKAHSLRLPRRQIRLRIRTARR